MARHAPHASLVSMITFPRSALVHLGHLSLTLTRVKQRVRIFAPYLLVFWSNKILNPRCGHRHYRPRDSKHVIVNFEKSQNWFCVSTMRCASRYTYGTRWSSIWICRQRQSKARGSVTPSRDTYHTGWHPLVLSRATPFLLRKSSSSAPILPHSLEFETMGHQAVWNSHPKGYGQGSRPW